MFLRKLGSSNSQCVGGNACPNVILMNSGDVAIIGQDMTTQAEKLPSDCGCGPGEKLVKIPRQIFEAAARDFLAS